MNAGGATARVNSDVATAGSMNATVANVIAVRRVTAAMPAASRTTGAATR
ncbi:MAG: hypothetical protein QOF98_3792, partial [Streptomyces sp.]|nr:hypothetical protein [Streptomyces sp.]